MSFPGTKRTEEELTQETHTKCMYSVPLDRMEFVGDLPRNAKMFSYSFPQERGSFPWLGTFSVFTEGTTRYYSPMYAEPGGRGILCDRDCRGC